MGQLNIISSSSSLILIIIVSLVFIIFGVVYSKKYQGLENYLVANRSVGVFSLTTSLVASALGAWILFGPASAATWGGIGAVIGYALGTAFPLFILVFLGKKFRKLYPKGKTLIEVVRLRFGKKLFKLILFLTIFYMFIFLIAEVTAVSILVNYISGTTLWVTALIVIFSSLVYTLYGGLRASIFTDNIQFIIILILLLISFINLISFNFNEFNFEFIKQNKPVLLRFDYLPNFTAGLTFFIAVAATNLFHQGNWQRVYAAQNNKVLKKSLIVSFLIISCAEDIFNNSASKKSISTISNDSTFTVLTWNIENFAKFNQQTVDSVSSFITQINPDLICLQEIKSQIYFNQLINNLNQYDGARQNSAAYDLDLAVIFS